VASKPERPGPPVAGIGASAGGLDAFKKFFAAMPPDSGIAFVLVPHLDPAHKSLMVELLARHTTMPVVEAANDLPVEANRVYVIPPNKYMTIHGGALRLTGPVERRTSQTSIDLFLRSLADDQQERSICIILSGTGSHGTLGLKAVKAAGGMAMVQGPATAAYERMPQNAVATGLADYVLPVEQMPEALVKYVTGRRPAEAAGAQPTNFAEVAQRALLDQFAPAAVLINRNYEILYYFGPCAQYLELPPGEPTHDLTLLAREGLPAKLRAAVHRAIRENKSVVLTDVQVKRNSRYHPVRVTVRPVHVPKAAEGLLLIAFEYEAPPAQPSSPSGPQGQVEAGDEPTLRQLEHELKATRDGLQSTIEELESSNDELKASNEETMSMHEGPQSANEEMETSKDELQSLNEELSTVNNQLQEKVDELEKTNNDLANLLNCTDIATIFLDAAFRIKLFTPAATKLFNLIASDLGRPVSDIMPWFSDPDLLGDAQQVLQQLAPREKEVSTAEGGWWTRRILPYRTRDNRIDGVVITFVDITERKQAADAVVRRLAAIVESSADAIYSKDLDGTVRTWNRGAERLYGHTREEAVGQSVRRFVPEDRAEEWATVMARLRRGESVEQLETERVRKDGRRVPVALTVWPVQDGSGRVVSASVIARDISERMRAEQALRDREERLQAILNAAADAIITIDQRGLIQSVNPAAERMFGYAAAEMVGQSVNLLMPSPYREEHDGYLERYLQTGEKHIIGTRREVEGRRKDGSVFPTDLVVSEIEHLKLFLGIHRDITRAGSWSARWWRSPPWSSGASVRTCTTVWARS
jgi:two-component system CheB/CheR fusion protein